MFKVLISDKMSVQAKDIFEENGIEVHEKIKLAPEDLERIIGDYDGLIIRSGTKVTAQLLAYAKKLKIIGRAGIGVDNIDVKAATSNGIVVMNTPFGNSITTAEHAVALIFSLARKIPDANVSTHAGKWEKNNFIGTELLGKTLGIIGCGNVGSIVADRALGLKMKVIAYDPYLSADRARDIGVKKVSLNEVYQDSDFLSLHTPLTDTTVGMINAEAFAIMKRGIRIINCARGGLINENDLLLALKEKKVAGVAIDVFEEEPAYENVLFGKSDVIVTPHLGASTLEAQENVSVQVAEQVSNFLINAVVVNALNMPSISIEDAPKLKHYLKLAGQMGSFVGQIVDFEVLSVTIEFEGQVAKLNTHPLTAVVLEGIMKHLLESVNMVNAPYIARERGIEIIESNNEHNSHYHSSIRLIIKGAESKASVVGTIFGGNLPRLVEVNGIRIEAELNNNMLFVTNDDQPGFIGILGKTLGDAGVNIGTLQLGRKSFGGKAMSLISIDNQITKNTLDILNAIPLVNKAIFLRFD